MHVTREHQSVYEEIDLCNDHSRQFINPRRQIHSETERHLQEMLRQHSVRITAVERKLVLVNTSGGSSGAASQRISNDEGSSVSAANLRRQLDNVQESSRRSEQRMESIEHALRNGTLAELEEYVKRQKFPASFPCHHQV